MKPFLKKVVEGEPLSRSEAKQAMEEMINGNVPQTQIASFLTAMRMKGETVEELIGFVEGIRKPFPSGTRLKKRWILAEPAGTDKIHLTFQQRHPSLHLRRGCPSSNTETARYPAKAGVPMPWRP